MAGPLRDAEQNQTPEEAITQGSHGNPTANPNTFSRREFLRLAAFASAGTVFAACAPAPQPPGKQTEGAANTPVPTALKPALGPTPTPQRIDSFDPQTGQMEFATPAANERRIAVEDRFYTFLQETDPFKSQYPNVPVVEFGINTGDPNKPRFVFIYGDGNQPPASPTLSPDKKFNVQVGGKLYYAVVDSSVEDTKAVKFTKATIESPDIIPARTVYDPKTSRVEYIDAANNSLGYVELSGERAGKLNKPEKPTPTETLQLQTLRSIGEKIGYYRGTTFDNVGAERTTWNNPKFEDAVSQHFTIVMPPAVFLPSPPRDANPRENRRRIDDANQILFIQPGLAPPQDRAVLKDASREDIIKYEKDRISYFLSFVKKVSDGVKPTYIYLFNEAFWDKDWQSGIGEADWYKEKDNPYFKVHGDRLFIELYLMYHNIAQQMGLEIGRDFRLIYNDYNINRPKAKVQKVAFEIDRARKEISRILNKPLDQIYIDAGIQSRFRYQANRSPFHQPPPTEDELRQAVKILKNTASQVHFTETTVIGAESQNKITNDLMMLDRVAVDEGVNSITYWLGMLSPGTKDPDVQSSGPTGEPLGLFDAQANPTEQYKLLVQNLISSAKQKGLL